MAVDKLEVPTMVTWWRADGLKIDIVVPDGGSWIIDNGHVYIRDENGLIVSVITLAPGEAVLRWEGPEGTTRSGCYGKSDAV